MCAARGQVRKIVPLAVLRLLFMRDDGECGDAAQLALVLGTERFERRWGRGRGGDQQGQDEETLHGAAFRPPARRLQACRYRGPRVRLPQNHCLRARLRFRARLCAARLVAADPHCVRGVDGAGPRRRNAQAGVGAGYWFGVGHFTVGLNWIAGSFRYQETMPVWLGWFAVVALALYIAVYPALAAGLAWRWGGQSRSRLCSFSPLPGS